MANELNIPQSLYNVNMAFQAWGAEVYQAGVPGSYSEYTQDIDGDGAASIQLHFLANVPVMRKWTGARQHKALRAYSTTITYDDYEATLPVKTRLVDLDKAGIVKSLLPAFLGQLDAYDAAVTAAFDGSSGAGPTGFDGVALFSDSHPHANGGGTQDNLLGSTNLNHSNLVVAEYTGALFTQENGRPCNVTYDRMRVGPKLKRRAMELLSAQRVVGLSASDAEGGTTVGVATRNNTFEGDKVLIVDPRVTTFYWDLIDTTKGPVRPMVLFRVKPPTVVIRDQPEDPHVFESRENIYGVEGRWGVAAGHWYTCIRGTGSA